MSKKRKIILGILGVVIILLIIGLITINYKPKKEILTYNDFISNYEEVNKNNDLVLPLEKHIVKKEKNKITYLFENKFYLVVGNNDSKIDKVYLYTKKDEAYNKYLFNMIKSIDLKISNKKINNIVNKMTDIANKKSDKLGFLVNFELDGYNYITMEKEQGKAISFFIYQLD